MNLSANSLRVLGSLMEKEMVTPDAYPLSVNALLAASNQRSSREPVMDLEADDVRSALDVLETHELVTPARDAGRVARFEHRIRTVLNLRRDETAIICLLLLRGPQTPGELRSRAERMFRFEDLPQLQAALERLAAREQPLVQQLPRLPGAREARWMHLLGDPGEPKAAASLALEGNANFSELESLRAAVAALELRVAALERRSGTGDSHERSTRADGVPAHPPIE